MKKANWLVDKKKIISKIDFYLNKEGAKFDEKKIAMNLLPPDGLAELARVFHYGAKKYAPGNWAKGMKFSRLIGAAERHLQAFKSGEDLDRESGLFHVFQAAWNCLVLGVYVLRGIGVDDREKCPAINFDYERKEK